MVLPPKVRNTIFLETLRWSRCDLAPRWTYYKSRDIRERPGIESFQSNFSSIFLAGAGSVSEESLFSAVVTS